MATQGKFYMRAVRTIQGVAIPRWAALEAATQTFTRGALVFANTNGQLVECGADPALILGVSTAAGGNNASANVASQLVELAYPGTLFRAYADSSGGEGTGVLALTDRMKGYGVAKSASGGYWFIDTADATNDRVVVWDSWDEPGFVITDVRPHVYCTFLVANSQSLLGT